MKVLLIGGTGYFGRLIADDLRRFTNCEVLIPNPRIDLWDAKAVDAALAGIAVAICAAGPFQQLPTTLAEACLRRGVHYIDIADDRAFVGKVRSLVPADARDVPAICSGWSTVSALSGVLVQIATSGLSTVDSVYIQMAPGNRGARNRGTIESLLHSVGKQFTVFRDGAWQTVKGWSAPREFLFPLPVGRRAGYLVDVPDHELFPDLFRARTVEFRAGSEYRVLNSAVALLSGCARHAGIVQRVAALFSFLGHEWGAVGVEVTGAAARRVSLIARTQGQRIAAMPPSVMTALLLSGSAHRGLVRHNDWLTRKQLLTECQRRGFELIIENIS